MTLAAETLSTERLRFPLCMGRICAVLKRLCTAVEAGPPVLTSFTPPVGFYRKTTDIR